MSEKQHVLTVGLGGWRLYCPLKKYAREIPKPKNGKTFKCWGCEAKGQFDILKCK